MNNKLCAAILGGLVAGLFLRRLATRGGATDDEVDASLAGDDVIPAPHDRNDTRDHNCCAAVSGVALAYPGRLSRRGTRRLV